MLNSRGNAQQPAHDLKKTHRFGNPKQKTHTAEQKHFHVSAFLLSTDGTFSSAK